MTDSIKARELLKSAGYTCVICREDEIYTSEERGVRPLLEWLDSGADFTGFSAADKVVGRGAAFLYVLLGVRAVYAGVISRVALCVLRENNIEAEYGELVDNIINRAGDGICPIERAVSGISDPVCARKTIIDTIKKL